MCLKSVLSCILFASVFFLPAAEGANLTWLDCMGSNGVIIKGQGRSDEPLLVQSYWGFLRKEFLAELSQHGTAEGAFIHLRGGGNSEFLIALDATSIRKGESQKASGTIFAVSSLRNAQPVPLSWIRCEFRVR